MHPSVIAGAMPAPLIGEPLGGCRLQSLPCKGRCRRRRRRGAAPCHAFTFTGQQCPHRPANLSAVAMLPGGRNRPPYNARQTAGETGNFAFAADVSFPGTHLRGIVGRAFTPAARVSGRRSLPVPCPHRPANLSAVAMLPGGRNRPPYNARQTAGETGNFAFAADVSFPGTHLRRIVGRAFTPAARVSGRRPASERAKRTDHQNSELLIPDPDPYHTQILSETYKH